MTNRTATSARPLRRKAQRATARQPLKVALNPATLQRTLANPQTAAPNDLLALQSAVGNRAVQRALLDPVYKAASTPTGGGAPLDRHTRSKMERSFGTDLSAVRVHENAAQGAKAFARGTDVYFGAGEYQPGTPGGDHLIGHELAHVVQQGAGRVATNMVLPMGGAVNLDPALEREADQAGARAAQGQPAGLPVGAGIGGNVIQGFWPVIVRIFGKEAAKMAAEHGAMVVANEQVQGELTKLLATMGPKIKDAILANPELREQLLKANFLVDVKDAAAALTQPVAAQVRAQLSGLIQTPEAIKQMEAQIQKWEDDLRKDLESTGIPQLITFLKSALSAAGIGALTEAGVQYIKSLGPSNAKEVMEMARPMARQLAENTAKPLVENLEKFADTAKSAAATASEVIDEVGSIPLVGSAERAVGKFVARPILEAGKEAASIQTPTIDVASVTNTAKDGVTNVADDAVASMSSTGSGMAGKVLSGAAKALPYVMAVKKMADAETALDTARAAIQPATSYLGGIAGGAAAGMMGAGPVGAAIGATAGAMGLSVGVDQVLDSVKTTVNPMLESVSERASKVPVVGDLGRTANVLLHGSNVLLSQVTSRIPWFGGGQDSRDKAWSSASGAVSSLVNRGPTEEPAKPAAAPKKEEAPAEAPRPINLDLTTLGLDKDLESFAQAIVGRPAVATPSGMGSSPSASPAAPAKTTTSSGHRIPRADDVWSREVQLGDRSRQFNISALREEAQAMLARSMTLSQVRTTLQTNAEYRLPMDIVEQVLAGMTEPKAKADDYDFGFDDGL